MCYLPDPGAEQEIEGTHLSVSQRRMTVGKTDRPPSFLADTKLSCHKGGININSRACSIQSPRTEENSMVWYKQHGHWGSGTAYSSPILSPLKLPMLFSLSLNFPICKMGGGELALAHTKNSVNISYLFHFLHCTDKEPTTQKGCVTFMRARKWQSLLLSLGLSLQSQCSQTTMLCYCHSACLWGLR